MALVGQNKIEKGRGDRETAVNRQPAPRSQPAWGYRPPLDTEERPGPETTRLALKAVLPSTPETPGMNFASQDVFFRSGGQPISPTPTGRSLIQAKFWEMTGPDTYVWHEEEPGAQFEPVMEGKTHKKYGRQQDWFSWHVYRQKPKAVTAVADTPVVESRENRGQQEQSAQQTTPQPQGSSSPKKKKKNKAKKDSIGSSEPSAAKKEESAPPENPLTSWQAEYRRQPEVKKWEAGTLSKQLEYLQKQIDAEWQKYNTQLGKLQLQAARPENLAFKGDIERVIGQLQTGWPVYNGKVNDFPAFIGRAKELANDAADYVQRAERGWNYFLRPQAEDMWWRFLPATNNENIKRIATHANVTQHTADHRPETMQYFQTALKDKHYALPADKVTMLNGSGHLYDAPHLNKLTVDSDAQSLERLYGYVWQNGTVYVGGHTMPGAQKKMLSQFPLFDYQGTITGTFTLSKPLMVIVNTLSNDLSKEPGTAFIKT